jgi:hypothetical protein
LTALASLSWLAAALLVATGAMEANVGLMLWPAAALHGVLGILPTRAFMASPRSAG